MCKRWRSSGYTSGAAPSRGRSARRSRSEWFAVAGNKSLRWRAASHHRAPNADGVGATASASGSLAVRRRSSLSVALPTIPVLACSGSKPASSFILSSVCPFSWILRFSTPDHAECLDHEDYMKMVYLGREFFAKSGGFRVIEDSDCIVVSLVLRQ